MTREWRKWLVALLAITGVLQALIGIVRGSLEGVFLGIITAVVALMVTALRGRVAPTPVSSGMTIGGVHVVPLAILAGGLLLVATTSADDPSAKIYAGAVLAGCVLYMFWVVVSRRDG